MNIIYKSSVIFVKDINVAKNFYQDILNQSIQDDFGRCIGFQNGLSIWERDYALELIFQTKPSFSNANAVELYFECSDIEDLYHKIKGLNLKIISELRKEPWEQKTFRFYDHDNYIIEIAEPMENVIKRLYNEGNNIKDISSKTTFTEDKIEKILTH